MRLATIRRPEGTRAVRLENGQAIDLGVEDLVQVLRQVDWRTDAALASGPSYPLEGLEFAPLVVAPEKVVCVGLNYRTHILEMGRELPTYPTLFAKYSRALIGAYDDIELPSASDAVDWEAELGVVIGATVRNADRATASQAIAGYTIVNDVTCRDWQNRTLQWLQGKTFEATTPIGPWLVTDDAALERPNFELTCEVDGDVKQSAETGDLVFDPWDLVSYVSTVITLVPGDVIATGTPGGVGHAAKPPQYLSDGATLVTRISGLGECRNVCHRSS